MDQLVGMPQSSSDTVVNRHHKADAFRWERDLVSAIEENLEPWGSALPDSWVMLSEVRAGTVLADLVFLKEFSGRWPQLPENLSPTEALCLAWLRIRRATRIDFLEGLCGVPRGGLRNGTLSRLRESGILRMGKGGRVALGHDWSSSIEIVAVEAKLHDWKKALSQASSNKSFADLSYVAMPRARASLVPRLEEAFRAQGVGLFLVSQTECEEVVSPKTSDAHTWRREYVYSRALGGQKDTQCRV